MGGGGINGVSHWEVLITLVEDITWLYATTLDMIWVVLDYNKHYCVTNVLIWRFDKHALESNRHRFAIQLVSGNSW